MLGEFNRVFGEFNQCGSRIMCLVSLINASSEFNHV
jgi:hypothetical protein